MIDAIDKQIINIIQSDFPITGRPYQVIAEHLGLDESGVIRRIKSLKENGIIRRIGGNFSPGRLGYVSTLCAAKVPTDAIAAFTRVVNTYPGVTHNYERDHAYNIWFTFIAPSMEIIQRHLMDISQTTGVTDILNLPATHLFKLNAQFTL
ncbi:MAG: AsnC family protein [Deltaproteobacteria bacterium]|nr:MAG: AsnC family protein [Deltaproteobacteria bacterium]